MNGDLYEAIVDDTLFAALPALVAARTGGRSGVIYMTDLRTGAAQMNVSYFQAELMAQLDARAAEGLDIWMEAGLREGIYNRAMAMDDFVPEAIYRGSIFYNELIRPTGDDTGHSMGIMHRLDDMLLCTAVQRGFGAGAFGLDNIAQMDSLAHDLQRIFRARAILAQSRSARDRLADLLDAGQEMLLLVKADLTVVEASRSARSLLRRADGLSTREGKLRTDDPALAHALRRAAATTIDRRPGAQMVFACARASGQPPLHLLILPAQLHGQSACVIRVSDEHFAVDRLSHWLTHHYRATPSELAVAQALLEGRSPEEIATLRQVSILTVRSQIKQLLAKTETRSITALVLLLGASPRRRGQIPHRHGWRQKPPVQGGEEAQYREYCAPTRR